MNPISIRNLRSSDTEVIEFIKKRLEWYWYSSQEAIENEYITPSFAGTFPYIFIALTSVGEFAGMVFLVIEEKGFLGIDNEPWITSLFVKEEFRKKGIARMLIKTAEEKCRKFGYTKLYLDTVQAEQYYSKLGGWTKIGTDFWGEIKEETTVMVKELC